MMNMHVDIGPEPQRFYSGGHKLQGQLFLPPARPLAVAVLNPATGVPQSYYAAFAQWLAAEKGIACLTYDYRDFGASARRAARQSRATMVDWGVHDQQAARDHLAELFPGAPLWVIGHSLGGLLLSFQQGLDRIDRVITVASGPVHFSDHPFPYRVEVGAFWHLIGPPLTKLMGYVPGRRLGYGFDLPAGVFWQWRRWCTSRGFFAADIGHRMPMPDWNGLKAEMKVVAIKDDVMVPPAAVWRLMQFYPWARKKQLVVDPRAHGLQKIGHIGPFATRNKVIWDALIA